MVVVEVQGDVSNHHQTVVSIDSWRFLQLMQAQERTVLLLLIDLGWHSGSNLIDRIRLLLYKYRGSDCEYHHVRYEGTAARIDQFADPRAEKKIVKYNYRKISLPRGQFVHLHRDEHQLQQRRGGIGVHTVRLLLVFESESFDIAEVQQLPFRIFSRLYRLIRQIILMIMKTKTKTTQQL